ncbi:P-loop containing nucleoside triphosphate hydrolase protein [Lasiosphaeria ovina]|uniref:Gluconokinase n=1 Tax=Lasiosphaeria ovina TaxID=92902 RepID=A0AAE0NFR3_9PEZI|nr:P-loop containing nucleoside triphosphate hydrolase protein [Lasiosphaeria ovina]
MGDSSALLDLQEQAAESIATHPPDPPPQRHLHRWIWFITGPTACGKTTVAKALAAELGFTFVEGDDFHPKANVDKMGRGEPLTDDDRAGWLQALREHETAQPPRPKPSDSASPRPPLPHMVMTCSALKQHYRDVLRAGGVAAGDLRIGFVFLDGPEPLLAARAAARKGHFAGPELVHSQFLALERPGDDEEDVILVGVDRALEDTQRDVTNKVKEAMMRDDGSYLALQ